MIWIKKLDADTPLPIPDDQFYGSEHVTLSLSNIGRLKDGEILIIPILSEYILMLKVKTDGVY